MKLKVNCLGYDADAIFKACEEALATAYVYLDSRCLLDNIIGYPVRAIRTKAGVELEVTFVGEADFWMGVAKGWTLAPMGSIVPGDVLIGGFHLSKP